MVDSLAFNRAVPLSAGLEYQSHSAGAGQKTFKVQVIQHIREFRVLISALEIGMGSWDQEHVYESGILFEAGFPLRHCRCRWWLR